MSTDSAKSRKDRRAHRDPSIDPAVYDARQQELQRKRERGELACVECSRLKMRCDKQVPCSSCVRRGCHTICPNGSLPGGQGTRFVLANADQLHTKLTQMSERIRNLEDALEIMQGTHSDNRHPLLQEQLKAIKSGIEQYDQRTMVKEQISDAHNDPGTLNVSMEGASRFSGHGTTESLASILSVTEGEAGAAVSVPPFSLDQWSEFAVSNLIFALQAHLPGWERASFLCEGYLEQLSFFIFPIQRSQLVDEVLVPIYAQKNSECPFPGLKATYYINYLQHLALLFAVFAVGTLADTEGAEEEGERYHEISRYITSIEMIPENPSLLLVQTLGLMSTYMSISDRTKTVEIAWTTATLATIFASVIGLHRDPARWKVEPKMAQRRRQVFWQIMRIGMWHNFLSGRPSQLAVHYRDCEFPEDNDQRMNEDGTIEAGYWHTLYVFVRDILQPMNDLNCSVESLQYSEVLELDRRIRDFQVPQHLQIPPVASATKKEPYLQAMHRYMIAMYMDTVLLYLHRSFFAKAVLDYPEQPMKSPYAPSFLAAYRGALSAVKVVKEMATIYPNTLTTSWILWKHVFGALIIIGSIVIRGPNNEFTPVAVVELTKGLRAFEEVGVRGTRAKHALSILYNVQERAISAFTQYRIGEKPLSTSDEAVLNNAWKTELATFGGQVRLVEVSSVRPQHSPPSSSSPGDHGSISPAEGQTPPREPRQVLRTGSTFDLLLGYSQNSTHPASKTGLDTMPSSISNLNGHSDSSGYLPRSQQSQTLRQPAALPEPLASLVNLHHPQQLYDMNMVPSHVSQGVNMPIVTSGYADRGVDTAWSSLMVYAGLSQSQLEQSM